MGRQPLPAASVSVRTTDIGLHDGAFTKPVLPGGTNALVRGTTGDAFRSVSARYLPCRTCLLKQRRYDPFDQGSRRRPARFGKLKRAGHGRRPDNSRHPYGKRIPTLSATADATLDRLMTRIAAGDRVAFRALYDAQAPRLYGLAMRLLRQPGAASDAVHDTFVEVWEKARQFDPRRGHAAAWLGTMLRYRAIDALRRTAREDIGAPVPEEIDPDPTPLERLQASDEGRALYRCLDELDPRQRALVLSAYLDGCTHVDLSRRFAAPLGTVKSWIRRALQSLRGCLES
jgi:RNA polymerase sigma-70 factor, ECF subfamily